MEIVFIIILLILTLYFPFIVGFIYLSMLFGRLLNKRGFILALIVLYLLCLIYIAIFCLIATIIYLGNIALYGKLEDHLQLVMVRYAMMVLIQYVFIPLLQASALTVAFLTGVFLILYVIRCIILSQPALIIIRFVLILPPFIDCETSGLFPFFDKIVAAVIKPTLVQEKIIVIGKESIIFAAYILKQFIKEDFGEDYNFNEDKYNNAIHTLLNNSDTIPFPKDTEALSKFVDNLPLTGIDNRRILNNSSVQKCINDNLKETNDNMSPLEYAKVTQDNQRNKDTCLNNYGTEEVIKEPVKPSKKIIDLVIEGATINDINNASNNYNKKVCETKNIETFIDMEKDANDIGNITTNMRKQSMQKAQSSGISMYNDANNKLINEDNRIVNIIKSWKKCCEDRTKLSNEYKNKYEKCQCDLEECTGNKTTDNGATDNTSPIISTFVDYLPFNIDRYNDNLIEGFCSYTPDYLIPEVEEYDNTARINSLVKKEQEKNEPEYKKFTEPRKV